jgi:hypothetical protein
MSERAFHFIFGALLLVALSFGLTFLVYILIGWQVIEVIGGRNLTDVLSRLRYGEEHVDGVRPASDTPRCGFGVSAQRALRAILATLLLLSYVFFFNQLWIVSWFMGFALMAAGISGMCPMVVTLKKLGFR